MASLTDEAGRMAELPTLPIFFKLRGRKALIAGGGEPAVWKAEVLCAAGAQVIVVAEAICHDLDDLATRFGPERLRLVRRPWREDDFSHMALALGAIEDDAEAARFRAAAGRAGVPVNVIDKPAFCDFQFGTLVARGPLVLAITTDGAAPVFGQAIRARLEAWLPEGLRAWAQAAKDWRPAVQDKAWDFRRRRRFWEVFADRALAAADRGPQAADRDACFAAVDALGQAETGSVTLVGSGPGTAESVTFAAARALQMAEVLIFEADLPAPLVGLARREAAKRAFTSEGEALNAVIGEAAQGRRVVWLGTGNPATCRRWRVRADRLRTAGAVTIEVEGLSVCPFCDGRCSDHETIGLIEPR